MNKKLKSLNEMFKDMFDEKLVRQILQDRKNYVSLLDRIPKEVPKRELSKLEKMFLE